MADEPWIGKTIGGRYRVEQKIGEGGMAFVLLAHDQNLGAKVVIKMPRPALMLENGFIERFQLEIRALVQLSHPHVIKISDVGMENGVPYAVMQYLSGGTLKDRRQRKPDGGYEPVAPVSVSTWLPQIARALDFLHEKSFVHRDVKPQNILFDDADHVYLADFGIVKAVGEGQGHGMTQTGMAIGTAEYMAPEVCLGNCAVSCSDQYSLAVTVYEMLAGQCPIRATTPLAVIVQQPTLIPKLLYLVEPTIPQGLSEVVARGLEKNPHNRFATCSEFASQVVANLTATDGASHMVRRPCPKCDATLKIPHAILDKSLKCPTCQASIRVFSRNGEVVLALKAEMVPRVKLVGGGRTPQPPPLPRQRRRRNQPPLRGSQPRRPRPQRNNAASRWPTVVGILVFLAALAAVAYWFFWKDSRRTNTSFSRSIETVNPPVLLANRQENTLPSAQFAHDGCGADNCAAHRCRVGIAHHGPSGGQYPTLQLCCASL